MAKVGSLDLVKFDTITVNVGDAFDGATFTAPVNGIYLFMFNAFAFQNVSAGVVVANYRVNTRLQINGKDVDGLSVYVTVEPTKIPNYTSQDHGGQHNVVVLNKGDTVTMVSANDLYNPPNNNASSFVHFTGVLLDQTLF